MKRGGDNFGRYTTEGKGGFRLEPEIRNALGNDSTRRLVKLFQDYNIPLDHLSDIVFGAPFLKGLRLFMNNPVVTPPPGQPVERAKRIDRQWSNELAENYDEFERLIAGKIGNIKSIEITTKRGFFKTDIPEIAYLIHELLTGASDRIESLRLQTFYRVTGTSSSIRLFYEADISSLPYFSSGRHRMIFTYKVLEAIGVVKRISQKFARLGSSNRVVDPKLKKKIEDDMAGFIRKHLVELEPKPKKKGRS